MSAPRLAELREIPDAIAAIREQVARANTDEGLRSIARAQIREWPALWRALDRLLRAAEIHDDPCQYGNPFDVEHDHGECRGELDAEEVAP